MKSELQLLPTKNTMVATKTRFESTSPVLLPAWMKRLSTLERFILMTIGNNLVGVHSSQLYEDVRFIFSSNSFSTTKEEVDSAIRSLKRKSIVRSQGDWIYSTDKCVSAIRTLLEVSRTDRIYHKHKKMLLKRRGAILVAIIVRIAEKEETVVFKEQLNDAIKNVPDIWKKEAKKKWFKSSHLDCGTILHELEKTELLYSKDGGFSLTDEGITAAHIFLSKNRIFKDWWFNEKENAK